MEYLEIILVDFQKHKLDRFVQCELNLDPTNIRTSHFYDRVSGTDLEISQVQSIQSVLSPQGTGSIVLHQVDLGIVLADTTIIFSFDTSCGDITFHFPEKCINMTLLQHYLHNLRNKYEIPQVRFGYEPATDLDTCLFQIDVFNAGV